MHSSKNIFSYFFLNEKVTKNQELQIFLTTVHCVFSAEDFKLLLSLNAARRKPSTLIASAPKNSSPVVAKIFEARDLTPAESSFLSIAEAGLN